MNGSSSSAFARTLLSSTAARWQCRTRYKRTPDSRSTEEGESPVRSSSAAAAELLHFEASPAADSSSPSRSRHYPWTPTLGWRPSSLSCWSRYQRTPCITSGYTARGSPALRSSSHFKVRTCGFIHFFIRCQGDFNRGCNV